MFIVDSKWLFLFKLTIVGWTAILSGCSGGKKYELQATGALPGVKGELAVSEDNLGNTTLDITADFAGSSEAGKNPHYLAWVKSEKDTVRLGALNLVGQSGKLVATTNMKKFTVLITSEESPDIDKPVNVPILRSRPIIAE